MTPTDPTLTSSGHDTVDQLVAQPLMIAFLMIVDDVLGHGLLEVTLAEGNDAIETFMFDGANEALGMGIGVSRQLHRRRAVRRKPFASRIPSIH